MFYRILPLKSVFPVWINELFARVMLVLCVKSMGKGGCQIQTQAAIHFVTFSVVEWVDIVTRKMYDMYSSAKDYYFCKKMCFIEFDF